MTNYKRIMAGLFLIGSAAVMAGFAAGDDDPVNRVIAQLDKWISVHPQEKVYLQLDKPYYAIGDDIWFKAYVTVGSEHKLSGLSGVLNVELVNDQDSVKQRIKLPIINGLTRGDFALNDSIKEGNYRIRAYTNWMRNAGEAYFFDENIAIANAITNNVFTKTTYNYNMQGGQQKVSAIINYTGLDGQPFAGNQVSYQVIFGQKIIDKGKGQTDDKGNLNISFVNAAANGLKQGRIVTNIKLADRKQAEKLVLIKAVSDKVDLQFFAEGGNLVNGNSSKIAFKAVGADGLGVNIKGVILDDDNNQLTTFAAGHLGMGEFELQPRDGRKYKAKITYADGSENTVQLPAAVNTGYTLSIDNSNPETVDVQIMPGSVIKDNANGNGVMSLVAQSGGVIYYAGKSRPDGKFFTAHIPKSKFPTGIVQFTLFSSAGEPLNERLVFIQNHDQLKLEVGADQQTYAARQKVKIDLDAKDAAGKPVVGAFSVSVTDETKVPADEDSENNILSNLLLTADLRGYIEQPGYFFNNENEKTAADLDVLMLTQGYHRFEWKEVLSGSFPPVAYQPEKTLEISGHLKTLGGRPIPHGKVTILTTKGGIFILDTVADDQGRFVFKNLVFRDSIRFVVQARTAKDRKNVQIDLDNIAPELAGLNKNAPGIQVNISDGLSAYLQNSKTWYADQLKFGLVNHTITLKEVEIKAKKNPVEYSSNLNGPGNADQILTADKIGGLGCAKLSDCLQGMLFGVTFHNGHPYLSTGYRPMTVFVDGIVSDSDILDAINPADIQSIEVLRHGAYLSIYGGMGGNGVLIVTTKRGGDDYTVQRYAPGIVTYTPKGYYKARVFYAPQYDNPKTNTGIPDLRSTIYWDPGIFTGKDGKASFTYFNADGKGTYKVVIEGIDSNGNLGRQVYRYKVE